MSFSNNIIIKSITKTFEILPKSFRGRSTFLMIGIIFNSLFELFGLAIILPLLASVLKKDLIESNSILFSIYNTLNFPDRSTFIIFLCLLVFLCISVKNVFALWIQKIQMEFTWDVYESISSDILISSYRKGFLYFNQENSNKILNKIVRVPLQFSQNFIIQLFQFLNEIVILFLIVISLLIYDYKILFALLGIVLPVFILFYNKNKKRVAYYSLRLNDLNPLLNKPVFETVFGYVDLAIGGALNHFYKEYLGYLRESKNLRIRFNVLLQIPNRLIEVSVVIVVIIMVVYGHFYLEKPEKIITLLGVFGLAAYRSIPSINRLIISLVNVKSQDFNFDIFNEFFPLDRTERKKEDIKFDHEIEIKNLSFRFVDADYDILTNINLTINKGDAIGLIGKSGSGKTTLMNIMLGFLQKTNGSLQIDGVELEAKNLDAWQKKIGYVRQDVFLVDGSVSENIAFGVSKDEIDKNKLNKAIDRAQLRELVESLPQKENTNIGERGTKISGGQRQRIGIARALYNEVEILFFDEATSALDTQTEEEITESIRSLHNENLTMVIIAHRESTLKYCDRVIKIDNYDSH